MAAFLMESPGLITERLTTDFLFGQFKLWLADNAAGSCRDFSSCTAVFGTVINKIPGFKKSAHHGECAAYSFDDNVLVAYLVEQQPLSSSQGEWIRARAE
jgi:hypothetical protein